MPIKTEETSGKVMKLKHFISAQICPNFLHRAERQPEGVQVMEGVGLVLLLPLNFFESRTRFVERPSCSSNNQTFKNIFLR
tara:strand:- start:69 stop:311 length:243 start_codon:yes stop_codon:yes gene_type:complete